MNSHVDHSPPLRISFVGGAADQHIHVIACEEFRALERLYGRPTYSHLTIRASASGPTAPCQVSLYLTMPGDIDVHVDVPDHIDEWSEDPKAAVVEAFHEARGVIAERLAADVRS